ncbi:hypothetical protein GCM10009792_02660 [Microcella alkalica]|uniref:Uncharacterized protein n=1 Tax=Microcella alkalica TaxID=355930 RepID=A0A839E943_9MICO|nr:hypothetical protein [Microcella alkalica]MBA8848007.1 hypothetical protein [Microcella alkalica]
MVDDMAERLPAEDQAPADRACAPGKPAPGKPAPGETATVASIPAEPRRPPQRRRATTPPPPGSDPSPIGEPERHRVDENDARLTAEKPPHY